MFNDADDIRQLKEIILVRKICLAAIQLYLIYILISIAKWKSSKFKLNSLFFSLVSIVFVLFSFELFFTFFTKSHSVGYSYAGKLWTMKYWYPINKEGFRDSDIQHNIKHENIVFLGDSFTAGDGIENISDRYSDIVKSKMPNYNVYNLGISGIGTKHEFEILENTKIKPDILFLQYFFNDIDELLDKYGYSYVFSPYNDLSNSLNKLVKSSFLFNYIYWLLPHDDLSSYLNSIELGIKILI